jgi:hypothetical protein
LVRLPLNPWKGVCQGWDEVFHAESVLKVPQKGSSFLSPLETELEELYLQNIRNDFIVYTTIQLYKNLSRKNSRPLENLGKRALNALRFCGVAMLQCCNGKEVRG